MDASLAARHQRQSSEQGFGPWLAEMLNHAFGNPREEAAHQPPAVGVQPYTSRPRRRRDRRMD
ncbi:MAG: hypothetical protein VKK62_09190 [Synechococcaceae cyanobacterium]|nr:hypothetical protein [Synechococcaceae cyanobacterium]